LKNQRITTAWAHSCCVPELTQNCAGRTRLEAGGQFCLVVNGTLRAGDSELPLWSLLWVEAAEAAPELCAGPTGVEILVVRFPMPH
jgi:hypothetical protein